MSGLRGDWAVSKRKGEVKPAPLNALGCCQVTAILSAGVATLKGRFSISFMLLQKVQENTFYQIFLHVI